MIDHGRKLLFVHIARTGGTSIEKAFVGRDWAVVHGETKHLSATQMRAYYGEEVWDNYVKFSVVRNPWDRLVSMWATTWWDAEPGEGRRHDFKIFLERLRPHPSETYRSLFFHEILDETLDFVLSFESLQADVSRMLRQLGLRDVVLPHLWKTARSHYSDYYTPETAHMVRTVFQRDIERYGYEFEVRRDTQPYPDGVTAVDRARGFLPDFLGGR